MRNEFNRDFNIKTVKKLKKKGVEIYRKTWLPNVNGDFTNGETGYIVNDNGTSRVLTYTEVLEVLN